MINQPGNWSGQQDLNLRPAVPKTAALPGCAIPRSAGNGYMLRLLPARRSASLAAPRNRIAARSTTAAEDRAGHAVAGRDAVLARGAGDHLKHGAHRATGGDEAVRERLGTFGDAQDVAVAGDEDHVERDVGVVHPEGHRPVLLEIEQHAVAVRQLLAEHEAAGALVLVGGKFDCEGVDAALADDLDGRLAGSLHRRSGDDGDHGNGGEQRGRRPQPKRESACNSSDKGRR